MVPGAVQCSVVCSAVQRSAVVEEGLAESTHVAAVPSQPSLYVGTCSAGRPPSATGHA